MTEVAKPPSTSSMMCPQFRKAMRKVCHACAFWQPLPVSQPGPDSKPVDVVEWNCVMIHQATLLFNVLQRLDGNQAATESFRNTTWKDSQQTLSDVVEVVKHQNATNQKVRDSLVAVARQLQVAPPAHDGTRLLNGTQS